MGHKQRPIDFEVALSSIRAGNVDPYVYRYFFETAWNIAMRVELSFTTGNATAGSLSINRIERNRALNYEAQDIVPASVMAAFGALSSGRNIVGFTFPNGFEGFAIISTLDAVLNQVRLRIVETPGVVVEVGRIVSLEGSRG